MSGLKNPGIKNLLKLKDKNNWLTSVILLATFLATFIILIFAICTYRQDIRKDEIENTPFFNFYFTQDYKGFMAKSEENNNIKKVEWFIPNVSGGSIREISKHPNLLTVEDIINALAFDMQQLYEEQPGGHLKDIVRCNLFAITTDIGIPLGVKIEYEKQGEGKIYIIRDILFAKRMDTFLPFIEHTERNISEFEFEKFFKEQKVLLSKEFEAVKNIEHPTTEETGECRLLIDQPGMGPPF